MRHASAAGVPVLVVGGGLGGLVAAIACAEGGAEVTLLEARKELGGRARTTADEFKTNVGAHALYKGLGNWRWLEKHGLLPKTAANPLLRGRFVKGGRSQVLLSPSILRAITRVNRDAPVDESFRAWATEKMGETACETLVAIAAVPTFHHDPGELSAAFVWDRIRWVYMPPTVRIVVGGWQAIVKRLEERAGSLGVTISLDAPVESLPENRPVIIATELEDAARLLERQLEWPSGRCVSLDLGFRRRARDPAVVVDLENRSLLELVTFCDPQAAPEGHHLLQGHVGLRPGESPDDGLKRLEAGLDVSFGGWREREVWRRRQVFDRRTGALDLPGASWRDRPGIDQGEGRFLVGDMVAADGVLSEVSFRSAVKASELALAYAKPASGRSVSALTRFK